MQQFITSTDVVYWCLIPVAQAQDVCNSTEATWLSVDFKWFWAFQVILSQIFDTFWNGKFDLVYNTYIIIIIIDIFLSITNTIIIII